MIARMIEVIPARTGNFRNVHPSFMADAMKAHQKDMFEKPL